MFYFGFKLRKARIGIIAALLLLALTLIFCTSSKGVIKSCYNDADERVIFLRACGWETEQEYQTKTVTVPEVWSKVYEDYNKLQKSQGYDLSLFKGVTVTQYTYTVTNHPSEGVVLAHLLVYDGVIIGGDIMSTAANGFMTGLK